jgi:hypothetical protein
MKGTIVLANPRKRRYAVAMYRGDTIFEVRDSTEPRIGDEVAGDLESLGGENLTIAGRKVSVFVECFHCSRSIAARWVAGET